MKMNLSDKRRRRLKRRFMNVVKDDLKVIGFVMNQEKWKIMICCGVC